MSKLNKDILFLIFEEFQDDSKSLFSCLMVNKLWCETVLPILWKNPWRYNAIDYNNKNYLFATIASCLSDDIKEFLIDQGIYLPSISSRPLLFDYLSFCRSINIKIINTLISIGSSLLSFPYNQFILQQEFYGLFMKKCPELKYFDMRSIKHQIFYFPEARTRLESLCELGCDTSIESSYFYGLARICQYIQRLIIYYVKPKDVHGIAKLIEVQKNLKYFEWNDDFEGSDYFADEHYKIIFYELGKKADTLNHLILFFIHDFDDFDHAIMINLLTLRKLKTLIINEFCFNNSSILKLLILNDLEILEIRYIKLSGASIIIENTGGNLKEISLSPHNFLIYEGNFTQDSLTLIRVVQENCPLIEYLTLIILPSKNHFIEFEKLLKVCQKLKSLLLVLPTENFLENGEGILNILIRSAPFNLKEIRFIEHSKFSIESLKDFLENWKRCKLTILTSNTNYEGEDYKELINKYKNDGVIKDFRCESIENVENLHFKI
ncbi:uncharacterized protein OCT59_012669 [Rhizophagus irregularis]|uniref:uncharacterized protein n=1 Tax=Rhizophagus irregularis TaxID=588596 RepID=UPI00331F36DF|nr:hypothetical protein OCT59_012669 [Rhizophagus irregularis]